MEHLMVLARTVEVQSCGRQRRYCLLEDPVHFCSCQSSSGVRVFFLDCETSEADAVSWAVVVFGAVAVVLDGETSEADADFLVVGMFADF